MKLEAVASLIAQAGIAVPGENLFVYHLPDSVLNGVLIVDSSTGEPIDYEVIGFRKTSFQIIVRASTHSVGKEMAERIMNLLTITKQQIAPGFSVKYMRPRHEPVVYPISEGGHLEFSVNYDVSYIKS